MVMIVEVIVGELPVNVKVAMTVEALIMMDPPSFPAMMPLPAVT